MHDVTAIVTEEYVDNAVRAVKQDMKVWLMGAIMASAAAVAIPLAVAVFQLGSINQKLDVAFQIQTEHQALFGVRGERLGRVENNGANLTAWARTQGYIPPEPPR